MKLLTATESKDLKEQQRVRDILRTEEIEKAAKEARLRLANAEADFNTTLARNRDQWAKEEQEHSTRIEEMSNEIRILEARKEVALEPVYELKKRYEAELAEVQRVLAITNKKQQDNEELSEHLQDKLDEVGGREQDVLREIQRLQIQKEGIELQKQQTIDGIKALNNQIMELQYNQIRDGKLLDDRQTALFLQETSLKDREIVLQERKESLDLREKRLIASQNLLEAARKIIPLEKKGKTPKI
jgi:hypothetical protein